MEIDTGAMVALARMAGMRAAESVPPRELAAWLKAEREHEGEPRRRRRAAPRRHLRLVPPLVAAAAALRWRKAAALALAAAGGTVLAASPADRVPPADAGVRSVAPVPHSPLAPAAWQRAGRDGDGVRRVTVARMAAPVPAPSPLPPRAAAQPPARPSPSPSCLPGVAHNGRCVTPPTPGRQR